MNFAALADYRRAFDMNVRENNTIAPDLSFSTDVSVRRIDESNAAVDHQAANSATTEQVFELGKFGASVHSRNFTRIVMLINGDLLSVIVQDSGHIGEIVFTLAISRTDARERLKKLFAVK